MISQRPPPRLRDPPPRHLDRARTYRHSLGLRRREPGAHQLGHQLDRDAVRREECVATAVAEPSRARGVNAHRWTA